MTPQTGAEKFTRRQLTSAISAIPLLSRSVGATGVQSEPGNLQKIAADNLRKTSLQLAEIEVAMNVAPAFVFKP